MPSCYEFKGKGAGKGTCIKNNAASVWNRTSKPVTVYYNSGFAGKSQTFKAGVKGNLTATMRNENAGHYIGKLTAPSGSYATPPNNPYPGVMGSPNMFTKRAAFVKTQIATYTGEKQCYAGRRASASDHNSGNAMDCTISTSMGQYPNSAQKAQGWKLSYWLVKHATRLDVAYVIWDGKIWSASRGWRTYTVASDVTGGHYDHVHVSVKAPVQH